MEALQGAAIFLSTHAVELGVGVGAVLGSTTISLGAATCVLVSLPEDYLERPEIMPLLANRPRWVQIAARIGKNVLGVAILTTGVALALPGVVGPGTPLVLVGLILVDIPGKRRLERRILRIPRVLALVNRLRTRFGRPPLQTHSATRRRARVNR